jgi:methionine-rich copper-binding protein CopC
MSTRAATLSFVLLLASLTSALADVTLVQSIPAADSAIAAPRSIKLTFSEKITPDAGVQLSMADGMAVSIRTSLSDDGKTLIARPTSPFMPGKWILAWHATSAEGQKSQGSYSFTVK